MTYNYTKPRGPVAAMNKGPGPSYNLPSLTGYDKHDPRSNYYRGPAFQFGTPHVAPPPPCSPGPVYMPNSKFIRTGRDDGRQYTIYHRLPEISRFTAPAPGTYAPPPTSTTSARSPAYSFGVVCQPLSRDETPAPNVYNTRSATFGQTVESTKTQVPAFSMYSRSKNGTFYEDLSKTPGPGSYGAVETDRFKAKRPQYSMIGRNEMPGDNTQKPGPAAHCPEKVTANKRVTPRYSFGIRHSDYEAPLIVN